MRSLACRVRCRVWRPIPTTRSIHATSTTPTTPDSPLTSPLRLPCCQFSAHSALADSVLQFLPRPVPAVHSGQCVMGGSSVERGSDQRARSVGMVMHPYINCITAPHRKCEAEHPFATSSNPCSIDISVSRSPSLSCERPSTSPCIHALLRKARCAHIHD